MFAPGSRYLGSSSEGRFMPQAAICDTCGARSTRGGRVHRLNELGLGPENETKAIHLCEDCLEERQARTWRLSDDTAQRLRQALQERRRVAHSYTYLQDGEEAIRLMRLQPDWVDRQAVDT
jgi:hypothetical protein